MLIYVEGAALTGELHEVTFETLTYGGDALGHLADGRAVFVPFALPGERARVRLTEVKARFGRGALVEILQPSDERIEPRCKHFGVCGGCHYQHIAYERQLEIKTGIVRDQLRRIGKIENPPVRAIVPCASPWDYRNQLQFHVKRDGKLGFVRADGAGVFAVEECHLPQDAIKKFWPQVQLEEGLGLERVSVRADTQDDLMLILDGGSASLPEVELEGDASVVHTFGDETLTMTGEDHLAMAVLGRAFRVSPTSFFQVNTAMAEKMVQHVLDLLPGAADTIIDAYCGVGPFSAFMAPRCRRLIGIESSEAACQDFETNLDEFDNVELYEAPTEEVLPALEVEAEVILLDPPRAGLGTQIVEALSSLKPGKIIYASCDPSTLARDLKQLLENGYQLEQVTPFDMFPQTYHIESISLLERG